MLRALGGVTAAVGLIALGFAPATPAARALPASPAVVHVIAASSYQPGDCDQYQVTHVAETVVQGTTVVFRNLDLVGHNLVSYTGDCATVTPTGNGAFATAVGADHVIDTTHLAPGQYFYYCTPHSSSMRGTFVVVPAPA